MPSESTSSCPEPRVEALMTHPADGRAVASDDPIYRVNGRDGTLLRLVPAGTFLMGSTSEEVELAKAMDRDGQLFALNDEKPQFCPFVSAFYLGVYAVTNEQFAQFLTSTRPALDRFRLWLPASEHIRSPADRNSRYEVDSGYEKHPAIHLSWLGAEAYCNWAGLRLPSELEWEKAARGTDGRIFPWGNDWDEKRLRWHGGTRGENETTAPVYEYQSGCSPYGFYQMAGNVEEWCSDRYRFGAYRRYAEGNLASPPTGFGRVVRGGTCQRRNKLEFRCARRRTNPMAFVNIINIGLRCAYDASNNSAINSGSAAENL
jgi:formylglycine-generating enzyme required for sulfatase activity